MSDSQVAATAAKSLQSCPTLCDPIDGLPPGSPIPGILQARTPEWAAISFSNAWKWKVKVKLLSRVRLLATPRTAAYQAPRPWDFPGKSAGVGCHCLLQGRHNYAHAFIYCILCSQAAHNCRVESCAKDLIHARKLNIFILWEADFWMKPLPLNSPFSLHFHLLSFTGLPSSSFLTTLYSNLTLSVAECLI